MKIGFIGSGIMGRPMAENLLRAGHQLTVYGRRFDRIEPILVMGALGKKKQADGVDAAGLAQGLQADGEQAKSEAGGLLDFLGSAGGEGGLAGLAEKGKSLLGGLLG